MLNIFLSCSIFVLFYAPAVLWILNIYIKYTIRLAQQWHTLLWVRCLCLPGRRGRQTSSRVLEQGQPTLPIQGHLCHSFSLSAHPQCRLWLVILWRLCVGGCLGYWWQNEIYVSSTADNIKSLQYESDSSVTLLIGFLRLPLKRKWHT